MPERLNEIENSSLEDSPDRKTKIRKPKQNLVASLDIPLEQEL